MNSEACLFVLFGGLHAHAEGLVAFVAGWTGKAVEAWVGVDAPLEPVHLEAHICDHVTLWREKEREA